VVGAQGAVLGGRGVGHAAAAQRGDAAAVAAGEDGRGGDQPRRRALGGGGREGRQGVLEEGETRGDTASRRVRGRG
jgi:hypothetical protein